MSEVESILKEDWKKAKGIFHRRSDTCSSLAERNYDLPCDGTKIMMTIKGYFLHWCSIHHQPRMKCDRDRLEEKLKKVREAMSDE